MMAISEQQATSPYVGRRMSLDEFLALPEQEPALEYEDGMVTQKVSPQPLHGSIQPFLWDAFNRIGRAKQIGLAFTETRFVTEHWAPVPDVVFYRKARIRLGREHEIEDFKEPPDIAVEVVSPDQSVSELIRKCLRYIQVGAGVVLLVDPYDETVFLFRPGQVMQALRGGDRIDLDDVLPGFDLTVRALFDSIVPDWLGPATEQPE